jgi:xanthosine utilization system XapX-like protein
METAKGWRAVTPSRCERSFAVSVCHPFLVREAAVCGCQLLPASLPTGPIWMLLRVRFPAPPVLMSVSCLQFDDLGLDVTQVLPAAFVLDRTNAHSPWLVRDEFDHLRRAPPTRDRVPSLVIRFVSRLRCKRALASAQPHAGCFHFIRTPTGCASCPSPSRSPSAPLSGATAPLEAVLRTRRMLGLGTCASE